MSNRKRKEGMDETNVTAKSEYSSNSGIGNSVDVNVNHDGNGDGDTTKKIICSSLDLE